MTFQIDEVVLYSRSLGEYKQMFNLTRKDFKRSILSVADGPASFNCQLAKKGIQITSVDPIYDYSSKKISKRFYQTFDELFEQIRGNSSDWHWHYFSTVDDMQAHCEKSFRRFIEHYPKGRKEAYIPGELPELPFPDNSFDLVLCSHFLFLYSHLFDKSFHWKSIKEMLRIGNEVRVYPLHGVNRKCSEHLDAVMAKLIAAGYKVDLEDVPYRIESTCQKMLRIRRRNKD